MAPMMQSLPHQSCAYATEQPYKKGASPLMHDLWAGKLAENWFGNCILCAAVVKPTFPSALSSAQQVVRRRPLGDDEGGTAIEPSH